MPRPGPRPGFAFSTSFRVRYAEIDGQKVVFNSRYLEYCDAAVGEFWEWTGVVAALGDLWRDTEFHVRRTTIDYFRPFVLGDTVEAFMRIEKLGNSSLTQRFELAHAVTGELHASVEMVIVNVHLPTGRPAPIDPRVRAFLETLLPAG